MAVEQEQRWPGTAVTHVDARLAGIDRLDLETREQVRHAPSSLSAEGLVTERPRP
jgi:hypothetical protein